MDEQGVVGLLDWLDAAGLRGWLGGGWGVDALVGRVTRPHQDVDLVVTEGQLGDVLALLGADGYAVAEDWLPVRAAVPSAPPRRADSR